MSGKPRAIVLAGPTASGKSALAMQLAERLPVEIVSVDSAQVYRDMNLGTAKPSAAERAAVPHHLLDLISPEEAYSAAQFRRDALHAMAEIVALGRTPLLVGGTMLYLKALREGLAELPEADPAVRAQLDREAHEYGWPHLHRELARLDAATAARLAPNDQQRIQRALEIVRSTGKPMSAWLAEQGSAAPLPFELIGIGLQPADMAGRQVLHGRIAERFGAMLDAGLVDEVRELRQRYRLSPNLPSMRCVGYRQAWECLDGLIDAGTLRDKGVFATRQLAKRQITWLRSMDWLRPLDCLAPDGLAQVLRRLAAVSATAAD